MARPSSAEGVIACSISISAYSLRVGAYTASNNVLCEEGLAMREYSYIATLLLRSQIVIVATYCFVRMLNGKHGEDVFRKC